MYPVPLQVFSLYTVILYININVGILSNKGDNIPSAAPITILGGGDLLDGDTVRLFSSCELLLAVLGSAWEMSR